MIEIVKIKPVIKWSGSKRSQSEKIIQLMPKTIETYYEPFVGGASVLYQLLHSDIKVKNYICSDFNAELITLWNEIKNNPNLLIESYTRMWQELNSIDDTNQKKEYFYAVRKRFNTSKKPSDFLFLSRTCTNGLIRYNSKGDFNTSLHFTRKGINPETLKNIIIDWSNVLNNNNVTFHHRSYEEVETKEGDFIYLDPPYAKTKGMYYGTINYDDFWEWLKLQKGNYFLSFDGTSGIEDNTYDVPNELYSQHEYLESGSSSFKRTIALKNEMVRESLYIK